MYVRITTIRGEADKVDAAVDYAENTARPAVEATAGNKGFATLTDRAAGVLIGVSLWDSAEAMAASQQSLSDARDAAAAAASGTASIENYEVAVAERRSVPETGAVVRMLRTEISPDQIDDGIALYRSEVLPVIESATGLHSATLLLDRDTGKGISVSAWDNEASISKMRGSLDETRARVTEKVGAAFTDAETYTLVRTTAQLD